MLHTSNQQNLDGESNVGRIISLNPDQNHIITSIRGRRSTGFLLTRRNADGVLTTNYHLRDEQGNVRKGRVDQQASDVTSQPRQSGSEPAGGMTRQDFS